MICEVCTRDTEVTILSDIGVCPQCAVLISAMDVLWSVLPDGQEHVALAGAVGHAMRLTIERHIA